MRRQATVPPDLSSRGDTVRFGLALLTRPTLHRRGRCQVFRASRAVRKRSVSSSSGMAAASEGRSRRVPLSVSSSGGGMQRRPCLPGASRRSTGRASRPPRRDAGCRVYEAPDLTWPPSASIIFTLASHLMRSAQGPSDADEARMSNENATSWLPHRHSPRAQRYMPI